jgi:holin-like protein
VLANTFKLPIPGPVIGLALLAGFAIWRGTIPQSLSDAGDVLLRYLSLLFVPAGVGLIAFHERLLAEGTRLLVVLVLSTAITMLVTALTFHVLTRNTKSEEKP